MDALKLEVVPESVQETNGYLHGICGTWAGSLEPIYSAIEEAVVRYLRETGRMR